MKKRNIVMAPCGNKSFLFRQSWLKDEDIREFDICLLFYHEHINQPELYNGIDYFFHLKDFKYKMIYNLLMDIKPGWLEEYEYFYFLDDDIDIDTKDINKLFLLNRAFGASISCASLSHDSFCSWPMFKHQPESFLRYVGQIEVMAPLFHVDTLKIMLPTFIENRSSWGIDSVWPKLLGYAENKLIIFDTVIMRHTLPVGGGELYHKIGVDPKEEWIAITDKYGAKLQNYREYGRLQFLNRQKDTYYNFKNSTNQNITTIKRRIGDYDFGSRVKSRLTKLSRALHIFSFTIK